jgi:hypothetical protein
MNLSDNTRRGQVYLYLLTHVDQWIDGPELANEEVGGSEGLKRLRELRAEGERLRTYRVESRLHPDKTRDIWQYRLVRIAPSAKHPPEGSANRPPGRGQASSFPTQVRPLSQALTRDADGNITYTPPPVIGQLETPVEAPPQPPERRFDSLPKRLMFGEAVLCPRCKGKTKAVKESFPPLHRDPEAGALVPCARCSGWGLVPNEGPIAPETNP